MIKKFLIRIPAAILFFVLVLGLVALFGPLGTFVVEPALRKWGGSSVPTLTLERAGGSLYSGIRLKGITLVSGDQTLLSVRGVTLRPSWEELLRGTIWLSALDLEGLSLDVRNLESLGKHYGSKNESAPGDLKPIRLGLRDITLETPLYSVFLEEGFLTRKGELHLSADLGGVPFLAAGKLDFSPLALSLDVRLGTGEARVNGRLSPPFDVEGRLQGLKLGALLSALTPVEGEGEISGRFNLKGEGKDLRGWGVLALTGGVVAGIPVEARIPWRYKDGDLSAYQVRVESLSADVTLKASADLRPVPLTDRLHVRGSVAGLSMGNLGRALSLDVKLDGDNGIVDFWVSADHRGNSAGKAFVRLPEMKAGGKQIVRDLRTSFFFAPHALPKVEGSGLLFGGKLRGEGRLEEGGVTPTLSLTAEGLDTALLAATFPALRPLAPEGRTDLTLELDASFSAEATLRSPKLVLGGLPLTDLLASVRYADAKVVLEGLKARIGRAPLDIAGVADLRASTLEFNGSATGIDPRSVPALRGRLEGLIDLRARVEGPLRSPRVSASVSGGENVIASVPVKRLRLSGTYADNRVLIPETILLVPGGSLSFHGRVDLPQGAEPRLDLSGVLSNLNLAPLAQRWGTDVSGRLEGSFKIAGPTGNAALSAGIRSDGIRMGGAELRTLRLDFSGTTQKITVRKLEATLNGGTVVGSGYFGFDPRDKFKVEMQVKELELRALLGQFAADGMVGGQLNGSLLLQGSLARPELTLKVTSPLTVRETLVDRFTATVVSPGKGQLDLNAAGKLGDLEVALQGQMKREKDDWVYTLKSNAMDLNRLVSAKMPSLKDKLGGSLVVKADGRLQKKKESPTNILISLPVFSASGLEVRDIRLPLRVEGDAARLRDGTGSFAGGKMTLSADIALADHHWKATLKVGALDLGKAAQPFLSQGALVGNADVNVNLKGNYGALMMLFANGDFRTGEGYIHQFKALDKVTKNGRVSFQEMRGSFFWDGKDLWLNPGTQVKAPPGEPLYRYFALNGPLGIPGKGVALNCQGRFDVQVLDSILGALKGAFQLMTGSLTGGGQFMRKAVSKVVGYSERDFQEVSFKLRGSWQELQLLDLKIDKSLQGFIPLESLNNEDPHRDKDRQIKFNLRFPTGPGGGEDSQDTQNQFKKQLIDNLLNQIPLK